MSNKTISINPSLFSIGGLKTKKNRGKKPKSTIVPLISPNVLKKKLLNRIREHKNTEITNLNNKTPDNQNNKIQVDNDTKENEENFSDEFHNSINYLQTLTAQKKINKEKEKYEIQKQKLKQQLEKKNSKELCFY